MNFKTKPYKHQLECLQRFGDKEYFALLAEMGTGKTWIIINNAADLWRRKMCDAVLVFAPNGVHSNWTRLEIPAHMPDDVPYICAPWSAAGRKQELADIEKIYGEDAKHPLRILTMNWESLITLKGQAAIMRFIACSRNLMIVADESDSIKNPSAKRTKLFLKLREFARWRRIMSGTPINNAPFDAFSQFNFLSSSILRTTSFWSFKSQYAELLQVNNALVQAVKAKCGRVPQIVQKGAGGRPKYKNLDKLSALIAPHSFRVLKEDCLDLPDKIYKTLHFDLTPQQRVIYKQCEKECRLTFEGNETPFNKLVAVTKLAQITSGYYIHPLAEEPVRIEGENPKLDLLVERVNKITETGGKVIVWARYRIEIADIALRLSGLNVVQYHGGITTPERQVALDAFEHGDAQVFIGNPQAGGMGITLVAASYVIYFSNDFSYRKRAQSEDRSHRIGQKKNVTYINIAAKGTIDEVVIRTLLNKKDVAGEIIDRGLELFNQGE
jgi:SNF2 family DNA or RNA helicase